GRDDSANLEDRCDLERWHLFEHVHVEVRLKGRSVASRPAVIGDREAERQQRADADPNRGEAPPVLVREYPTVGATYEIPSLSHSRPSYCRPTPWCDAAGPPGCHGGRRAPTPSDRSSRGGCRFRIARLRRRAS